MKQTTTTWTTLLASAAVAGNVLFMMWVTFNGIQEHFSGTIYQKLSYVGLMGLLIINTVLIMKGERLHQKTDRHSS